MPERSPASLKSVGVLPPVSVRQIQDPACCVPGCRVA